MSTEPERRIETIPDHALIAELRRRGIHDHLARMDAQEKEIERLSNENGSLRHNLACVTISHEQHNRLVALGDGLGFRGLHMEAQMQAMADELRQRRFYAEKKAGR